MKRICQQWLLTLVRQYSWGDNGTHLNAAKLAEFSARGNRTAKWTEASQTSVVLCSLHVVQVHTVPAEEAVETCTQEWDSLFLCALCNLNVIDKRNSHDDREFSRFFWKKHAGHFHCHIFVDFLIVFVWNLIISNLNIVRGRSFAREPHSPPIKPEPLLGRWVSLDFSA